MNDNSEITLLTDKQWRQIEKHICRISNFSPLLSSVKDGKVISPDKSTPFATITFKCSIFTTNIKGFICHKLDFIHLWHVFNERGVKQSEEVLFTYIKPKKLFSYFFPKLHIMICPSSSFELHTNNNFRPELSGEARYIAGAPILELRPDGIN